MSSDLQGSAVGIVVEEPIMVVPQVYDTGGDKRQSTFASFEKGDR